MTWDTNKNHHTMWFVEHPCVCSYEYSSYNVSPRPYFPELKALALFAENVTGSKVTNSVNVNYYDNHFSKVGLHSDSEEIFQADKCSSTIISISLGATRNFVLQAKDGSAEYSVDLKHADVLTMEGYCQKYYWHGLPQAADPCGPRVNLTFRKLVRHKQYCPLAKE